MNNTQHTSRIIIIFINYTIFEMKKFGIGGNEYIANYSKILLYLKKI